MHDSRDTDSKRLRSINDKIVVVREAAHAVTEIRPHPAHLRPLRELLRQRSQLCQESIRSIDIIRCDRHPHVRKIRFSK